MKRFWKVFDYSVAAICLAAAVALLSWRAMYPIELAQAQSGPPGLNPGNFISASATAADTSSSNITLGDSTHFTFVCGVAVSGPGATAATAVTATVGPFTTTTGGTVNLGLGYVFGGGAAVPSTPLLQNFVPCLPVSGVATLTVPGAAGNTSTSLTMWGYKQ